MSKEGRFGRSAPWLRLGELGSAHEGREVKRTLAVRTTGGFTSVRQDCQRRNERKEKLRHISRKMGMAFRTYQREPWR